MCPFLANWGSKPSRSRITSRPLWSDCSLTLERGCGPVFRGTFVPLLHLSWTEERMWRQVDRFPCCFTDRAENKRGRRSTKQQYVFDVWPGCACCNSFCTVVIDSLEARGRRPRPSVQLQAKDPQRSLSLKAPKAVVSRESAESYTQLGRSQCIMPLERNADLVEKVLAPLLSDCFYRTDN